MRIALDRTDAPGVPKAAKLTLNALKKIILHRFAFKLGNGFIEKPEANHLACCLGINSSRLQVKDFFVADLP